MPNRAYNVLLDLFCILFSEVVFWVIKLGYNVYFLKI